MKTIIPWRRVDKSNPIPEPANEKQVLVIYNKANDNEDAKRAGRNPYITVCAEYYLSFFRKEIPIERLLYWSHGWLNKERDGLPFIYDEWFGNNLHYTICEYLPAPAELIKTNMQLTYKPLPEGFEMPEDHVQIARQERISEGDLWYNLKLDYQFKITDEDPFCNTKDGRHPDHIVFFKPVNQQANENLKNSQGSTRRPIHLQSCTLSIR